jgi:hypothetical protein
MDFSPSPSGIVLPAIESFSGFCSLPFYGLTTRSTKLGKTRSRGILCSERRTRTRRGLKRRWPLICARCNGFLMEIPPLVWLSCDDYRPTQSDRWGGAAWECLNCGNYIDAVILANRRLLPQPALEQEAAVSPAVNRIGELMIGPTGKDAIAVGCFTQPTTLKAPEGMRSPGTGSTDRVSGFFPSEIEWLV